MTLNPKAAGIATGVLAGDRRAGRAMKPTAVATIPPPIVPKAAYRIEEFSRAYGVSVSFAYQEIAAGRLKTRKAGRRTLIPADEARSWLDSLPAGD